MTLSITSNSNTVSVSVGSFDSAAASSAITTVNAAVASINIKTFPTRSAAVAYANSNTFSIGAIITASGLSYRYTGSGAVISDLPGWVPDGDYTAGHWAEAADGSTDDATVYGRLAANLPAGSTLYVRGAGTRIIGSEVTFSQTGITIVCDPGVTFKQKSGTLSLDRMFSFTGANFTLMGGKFDQNLTGNAGTPTGRFEGVLVSGDYATLNGVTFEGSKDSTFGKCLIAKGRYGKYLNLTSYRSGRNAFVDQGDYNVWRGIRMLDITAGASNICHGWAKDSGYGAAAMNYTLIEDWIAQSTATYNLEAVLFDHDTVQGGQAVVRNGRIDFPNSAGPDVIKGVYLDAMIIDGLYATHPGDGSNNATLRLQEGIAKVSLRNVNLAGAVNFDDVVPCDLFIAGDCILGRSLTVPAVIQDFPQGNLTVEDGAYFKNFTGYAVTTNAANYDGQMNFGRLRLVGSGGAAVLVNSVGLNTSGTKRRFPAGQVTVRPPLTISGMKTLAVDGRWIGLSDAQDAACAQLGDRVFLASNSDFPAPRDSEAWKIGDVVRKRAPTASTTYESICVTAGASCLNAWAPSTAVTLGTWRYNGTNVYAVVTAGTTAGAGGPTGTGSGITDGTAVWDYVGPLAVFKISSTLGA
jgi:hypothetical protein